MTILDVLNVFQSFTFYQKEAVYELIDDSVQTGKYNHGLYYSILFGMTDRQKEVIDFLINEALESYKTKKTEVRNK